MKVLEEKQVIIDHCASSNTEEFNRTKVFEEISEFQEVMTKIVTKHPNNPDKPKKTELIKEFGDVVYRGLIYLRQQFPEFTASEIMEQVEARMTKKLSNLEEWKKEKLYEKGL